MSQHKQPKVSIIVPCYNVERYLDRCLNSLVNQTLSDIEIILVDDESPDNVPKMCNEWKAKDNRIKVIHKKNEGLGLARNSGLDVATGEFVAFVDSDDYVDLTMYEQLYKAIKRSNSDMVLCGYNKIYKDRIEHGFIANMPKSETCIDSYNEYLPGIVGQLPESYYSILYGYAVWNILFSNKIIKEHNIKFESERVFLSEDILFQIKYALKTQHVLLLPTNLYNYCQNEGSLTKKYDLNRFNKAVTLYYEIQKTLQATAKIDNIQLRTNRMLMLKAMTTVCDASKDLSLREAICAVAEICNNKVFAGILRSYPIHKMHIRHQFFFTAIRYKMASLIVALYKISH